eukprot:scaffold4.g4840.t1
MAEAEAHLVACVQESLALYLYDNAIFLCERLVADFPTEANVFLLATCYHRAGQGYRAYRLLRGMAGEQSRYLFALACLQLGKLTEAEAALLPDNDASKARGAGAGAAPPAPPSPPAPPPSLPQVPNGAAGFYLLGRIYQLSNRHSAAMHYYNSAVQLDPMLWSAFEELCVLGADAEAQQYAAGAGAACFLAGGGGGEAGGAGGGGGPAAGAEAGQASPSFLSVATPGPEAPAGRTPATAAASAAPHGPATGTATAPGPRLGLGLTPGWGDAAAAAGGRGAPAAAGGQAGAEGGGMPSPGAYVTPAPGARPTAPPPAPKVGGGGARPAWPATASPLAAAAASASAGFGTASSAWGAPQRKFVDEGKMRKVSGKLFADPASVLRRMGDARAGGGGGGAAAAAAPDGEAVLATGAVAGLVRGQRSAEGQASVLALLSLLAEGYRLLCLYKCKEAVEAFARLPPAQYQTGWVLTCVGRAFFEMVDYPQAARCFQWARQVDPYRLKGLEVYSTVLWHMRREMELSHLAQEAVALDRHSPYTWCVMGNCFSLQKARPRQPRRRLRARGRAPCLPAAGHPTVARRSSARAGITCYRNAIRIDPRHYNAWFGMGHIYYRQEKYGMAEYHFRRALTINERSSVLRCYLGMALHKLRRGPEALEALGAAAAADPRNPLAKFERALVLLAEERYRDALGELHALKDVAPREASVLFHMGKVYKKLGLLDEAMACFSNALDLQPPSADTNVIKAAIERINLADHEEEEEI